MAPLKNKSNLVFVRRQSGDIDIRRANKFTKRPSGSTPLQGQALHYVCGDRSRICRCFNPRRHHGDIVLVAAESTHLNASLTMYMDRYGLQSCTIADFRKSQQQSKASWVKEGIYIDEFHYASKVKDVVCRCSKGNVHSYGNPRNPEIIERCVEFFRAHKDEVSCSKSQWLCFNSDNSEPVSKSRSSHAMQRNRSRSAPEMDIRSTAARVAPVDMRHLRNGPRGEPDIPKKVWTHARPSLWIPCYGSESSTSTPIGSVRTPINLRSRTVNSTGAPMLTRLDPCRRESTATYWSNIQRDADVSDDDKSPRTLRVHSAIPSQMSKHGRKIPVHVPRDDAGQQGTPIAELPTQRIATELDTKPVHRHTATLRELEGRRWHTKSEPGKQSQGQEENPPSNASKITNRFFRMSSLFGQVQGMGQLPDQEEFLLRHAIFSSRTIPAPTGHCAVCSEPYQDRQRRILMLPGCGHYLHEQCLLAEFRVRDYRIGTCPICGVPLCERTLADRIDTDREAIFGTQFTQLRNSVDIKFPQRGEVMTYGSEEEIASAQLRLIKDHVNVHAEEIFRLWEANRAEPDWYGGIIRPVVKLFHSWNSPGQRSRYVSDREAFLKVVAWAELVRLINATHVAVQKTQGEDAAYPQLAELHRKFMWAKNRYDKEKKTWPTKGSGGLHCEKIAQDALKLAMNTHLP